MANGVYRSSFATISQAHKPNVCRPWRTRYYSGARPVRRHAFIQLMLMLKPKRERVRGSRRSACVTSKESINSRCSRSLSLMLGGTEDRVLLGVAWSSSFARRSIHPLINQVNMTRNARAELLGLPGQVVHFPSYICQR